MKGQMARDYRMATDTTEAQCPDCGRRLVERQGKYGPFLGCTGYPSCRHTQHIHDYHSAGNYSQMDRDNDGHWK